MTEHESTTGATASTNSNSRWIGLAVVAAAVLLLGGYWAVDTLTSPAAPDVATAEPAVIVEFMGHPKGLARMSRGEQVAFLGSIWPRFTSDDGKEAFATAFAELPPSAMNRIQECVFDLAKAKILEDAEKYNSLPEEKRQEFIRAQINGYDKFRSNFRGDTVDAMKSGLPMDPDEWSKSLMTRTTAAERALAQPFVEALQNEIEAQSHTGRWANASS